MDFEEGNAQVRLFECAILTIRCLLRPRGSMIIFLSIVNFTFRVMYDTSFTTDYNNFTFTR